MSRVLDSRIVALVVAGFLIAGGAIALHTSAAANAGQSPAATTTPVPFHCSGISAGGGQPIAYQAVLITPPTGYVYNWTAQSGAEGNWIRICVVELSSNIVIDSQTGAEIQRIVGAPEAGAVLDQIVAGTRINANPTPSLGGSRRGNETPIATFGPLPTRDPLIVGCPGGSMPGGRLFAYGSIIVEFPVGYVYGIGGQSDPVNGWTSLTVCVLEYGSAIVLDARTGIELRRNVIDLRAAPILDQIARDVTLNPMPTPFGPIPGGGGTPAPVQRGNPITPPKTGDAGLLD